MWCLKAKKTQVLFELLDRTQKSLASRQKKLPSCQKKFPLGLKDFAPFFGKLTTHYVMFESKKKTQILIEFLDRTQKSPASCQNKFPSRQKQLP